ncbi:MAG TPA: hypothetical protein VK539_03215 [Myxococcaceae bacterium]|nr:hypothetical protein [Myxococcaceae bacterium]
MATLFRITYELKFKLFDADGLEVGGGSHPRQSEAVASPYDDTAPTERAFREAVLAEEPRTYDIHTVRNSAVVIVSIARLKPVLARVLGVPGEKLLQEVEAALKVLPSRGDVDELLSHRDSDEAFTDFVTRLREVDAGLQRMRAIAYPEVPRG